MRRLAQHAELQFNVKAKSRDDHRTTVAVVRRIDDVLHIRGNVESFPHMHGVVALQNVLAPVVQRAVAEQESEAAIGEIRLVEFRDPARDEGHTSTVQHACDCRPTKNSGRHRVFNKFYAFGDNPGLSVGLSISIAGAIDDRL